MYKLFQGGANRAKAKRRGSPGSPSPAATPSSLTSMGLKKAAGSILPRYFSGSG